MNKTWFHLSLPLLITKEIELNNDTTDGVQKLLVTRPLNDINWIFGQQKWIIKPVYKRCVYLQNSKFQSGMKFKKKTAIKKLKFKKKLMFFLTCRNWRISNLAYLYYRQQKMFYVHKH